jgi:hypothetical protein
MFHQQVYYKKEQKVVSPIAVAVNVGDPELVELLFSCKYNFLIPISDLTNVNIEFGIEFRRKA